MKLFFLLFSTVFLFCNAEANIFLSEPVKKKVCDEIISEMVENDKDYADFMGVCLDAKKTEFCNLKIEKEVTSMGERSYVLYNIVDFKPTNDLEQTSYSVKGYVESGSFLREKAIHSSCE